MLIVSRRNAESILIEPADGVDPSMTLAEVFGYGPIEITIFSGAGHRVKMGVEAPRSLSIWRKEPGNEASGG